MPPQQRNIKQRYDDPIELIWTDLARQLGMRIDRDDEVFASWDGRGTLRLGRESLDPDDCLAQMILHELCHFFVEGSEAWQEPDWGLNGDDSKDRTHEFATLRLQAFLADQFRMRKFFAATTVFREYFDLLPADPFVELTIHGELTNQRFKVIRPVTSQEDQRAIEMACQARRRFEDSKWKDSLLTALRLTNEVFLLVRDLAPQNSIWA